MRRPLLLLALAVSTLCIPRAHASNTLPDACGADDIKFDVKTSSKSGAPLAPPDGKALIAGGPFMRGFIAHEWAHRSP